MPKYYFLLTLAFPLVVTGCATSGKSTALGAALGSFVGGSIGVMASQHAESSDRSQGMLIGAGFGGVLGALIGHESHKEQQKKDSLAGFDGHSPNMEIFGNGGEKDKRPALKPAQVKVRMVEDQVKDGIFVPAHFEYEIAEPARWEKSK